MVPPDLTALSLPDRELPRPGLGGRALGAACFVLTLICWGFASVNATHAAGLTGTHGTLTVEKCWEKSATRASSHRSQPTVCSGTFRSDDGKTVIEAAELTAELTPGDQVSVQQGSDRYVQTGLGQVSRWIAVFFGSWLLAAFGIAFAVTGRLPRRGAHISLILRTISGTRAGVVRAWLVRIGLAGAALFLVLYWML
jgi:hypothetical protein